MPGETSTFPNRPIKLIVPFGAGGGTDTFARIIKKAVEENDLLPQPLVIINVGGAGATIGSRRVKDAKPDGYTVLLLHEAILTAKYSGKVRYGPEAFDAVAGTGEVGLVLAVAEDSPFQTLPELMNAAGERPESIVFGANLGAVTHFAGLMLENASPGARFRFTQYGGGASRFAALKGGHIDVTAFSIEEFIRFRTDGLRGLAFFGDKKHPAAADVDTAREQGFDLINSNMFFWWVPSGTPKGRTHVLAVAVAAAMRTDYVQRKMAEIHCSTIVLRDEALTRKLDALTHRISKVAPRKTVPLPDFPNLLLVCVGFIAGTLAIRTVVDRTRQQSVAPLNDGKASGAPSVDLGVCSRIAGESERFVRRTDLAMIIFALTVLYVAVMALGWIGFQIATVVFLISAGMVLSRANRRIFPLLAVLSICMGPGIYYCLTHVFVVDLP